jgi:hypothetical protein
MDHLAEKAAALAMASSGSLLPAVTFFFARGMPTVRRTAVFAVLAGLTLLIPLAIPAGFPVVRVLVATTAVLFAMKMWDLHLDPRRNTRFDLPRYVVYLISHCSGSEMSSEGPFLLPPLQQRWPRLVRCWIAFLAIGAIVCFFFFRLDWSRSPFFVEHSLKAIVLGALVITSFDAYGALFYWAGARVGPFSRDVLRSASPADFWRRWNLPIQSWFLEDIFKPSGGFRNPLRSMLFCFGTSGIIHEYIVSVSLGRLNGCMLLFFSLQGIVSALTARARSRFRRGCPVWMGIPPTLCFMVLSSIFFFLPLNEILPIYEGRVPRWLCSGPSLPLETLHKAPEASAKT